MPAGNKKKKKFFCGEPAFGLDHFLLRNTSG